MSDFGSDPMIPQPPAAPAAPPPPPFGMPGGSTVPAYQGYPPAYGQGPGYPMAPAGKPPRPAVTIGAAILIVGGVLMILGSFLNWFTVDNLDFNGFSGEDGDTKDGPVFVFFGVLAVGFGIAQLAARKVLAVAILAVVFTSFAVLAALADLADVSDAKDLASAFGLEFNTGPGLYVILVGSLVALGGAIATLAKRRVWPKQA